MKFRDMKLIYFHTKFLWVFLLRFFFFPPVKTILFPLENIMPSSFCSSLVHLPPLARLTFFSLCICCTCTNDPVLRLCLSCCLLVWFKADCWISDQSFSEVLPSQSEEKPGLCSAAVSNGAFALQWGPDPSCGIHGRGDCYLVSTDLICDLYWLHH